MRSRRVDLRINLLDFKPDATPIVNNPGERKMCSEPRRYIGPLATVLLVAFGLFSCGRSARAIDPAIVKAREAIRTQLIDAESARFRNEETAEKGAVVCGEVNAKNRMGGYAGFVPYIHAAIASKAASIVSPGRPDFTAYLRMEDSGSEQDMDLTHSVKNACDFVATWELLCTERQKALLKDTHENCGLWLQGFETDVGMKRLRAKLGIP